MACGGGAGKRSHVAHGAEGRCGLQVETSGGDGVGFVVWGFRASGGGLLLQMGIAVCAFLGH